MAIVFDPATGLTVESAETVLNAIGADWQNAFTDGGLPPLDIYGLSLSGNPKEVL